MQVARFAKSLKPRQMDLNERPPSARQRQWQQEQQQNISSGHKMTEKDERAQLFATKQKTQPVEEAPEEEDKSRLESPPPPPPVVQDNDDDDDDEDDDELAALDIN